MSSQRFESLPTKQAMRRPHRVRKFRRNNAEHGGRGFLPTNRSIARVLAARKVA